MKTLSEYENKPFVDSFLNILSAFSDVIIIMKWIRQTIQYFFRSNVYKC